jgi:exodeoxyribonuclease VII small subunit
VLDVAPVPSPAGRSFVAPAVVRASRPHPAPRHQHRNSGFLYNTRLEITTLPKFEECLQRLEQIVTELEKGDIPLERALGLFEEGIQLSSSCRQELEDAEGKVEILLNRNGKMQAEPFEAQPEKAEAKS